MNDIEYIDYTDHSKPLTLDAIKSISEIYSTCYQNLYKSMNINKRPLDTNNGKHEGTEFLVEMFHKDTILLGASDEIDTYIIHPINQFYQMVVCPAYSALLTKRITAHIKDIIDYEMKEDREEFYNRCLDLNRKQEIQEEEFEYFKEMLKCFMNNFDY